MSDILMAIVDYIPVTCFLIGAIVLQRMFYDEMVKGSFAIFATGTISVFMAGFFKATWKLLYYTNICDWRALSNCFFPMQTVGFVLAGLGMISMLITSKKHSSKLNSIAVLTPAAFSGTMVFVVLMILGVFGLDISLIIVAIKKNKKLAIPLYIISIIFVLGMGYLSSKDFDDAKMNWIAEGVNVVGQACFMAGALVLNKAKKQEAEVAE